MSGKRAKSAPDQNEEEQINTEGKLIDALKAVKIGRKSVRATAVACGIPRTNLQRCITQFDATGKDITKMTDAELLTFVENKPRYGSHRMVK